MKFTLLLVLTFTSLSLLSSCQNRSSNSCCPCAIPCNEVTPKDHYFHNYYQSEPLH